jgi:hypothetical protein
LLTLAFASIATAQSRPVSSILTSVANSNDVISNFAYNIVEKKIILSWEMKDNERTDRFELERSNDGKIFVTAALLFGTDAPGAANYIFFEKVGAGKVYYRVKIFQKDNSIAYSAVLPTETKRPSNN